MSDQPGFLEWQWADLREQATASDGQFDEFLRVPEMSAGIYRLPAGGVDRQSPHREDEVYYVVRGHSQFTAGDETVPAGPGAVLYVRKGVEHRFHDITEDLEILVLFAPAETGG